MGAVAESVSAERETLSRGPEAGVRQAANLAGETFDPYVDRVFGFAPADAAPASLSVPRLQAPVLQRAQRLYGNRVSQQIVQRARVLQRQCACGGSCPKCQEEEEQHTLQRTSVNGQTETSPGAPAGSGDRDAYFTPGRYAPPIVHDVLRSSGQALDPATRSYFEPQFGRDFSNVRVHTDSRAAESASAVDALAYTVGNQMVWGHGQFAPHTEEGKHLLAHELTHVVQQSSASVSPTESLSLGDPSSGAEVEAAEQADAIKGGGEPPAGALSSSAPMVARACMTKEQCEKKTTLTPAELLEKEAKKPENAGKREKRAEACGKTPPDPRCTADGHGARAVQTEAVLRGWDPRRLNYIQQIVIDKDMESGFGALTSLCANLSPPAAGSGYCIRIPEAMEQEAAEFNTKDPQSGWKPTIGTAGGDTLVGPAPLPRDLWRTHFLHILVHETEHARFNVTTIAAPRAGACKFDDLKRPLSEIAAMLVEFPIIARGVRDNVSLTPQRRTEILDAWFLKRITSDTQSFKSTLHTIYCVCECSDAAAYVTKTIQFSTADWSTADKNQLHTELNDPKWAAHDLRWPVKPSAPVAPPPASSGSTP